MYIIAYSRLYLGMHSPADIIAGSFIGIVVMVAGYYYELAMETYGFVVPSRKL
jgi:membrane-associated phospholipid phosphatase